MFGFIISQAACTIQSLTRNDFSLHFLRGVQISTILQIALGRNYCVGSSPSETKSKAYCIERHRQSTYSNVHPIVKSLRYNVINKKQRRDVFHSEPKIDLQALGATNRRAISYSLVYQNLSRRHLRHYCHSSKAHASHSYSVLQSNGFEHWFKNWHEKRKHKLTASTFGGAIGFWPRRRVQLWQEKLDLIEPFTKNLAVCWNNIQEEVALERYKLITGNTVCFPDFQPYSKSDPDDDWIAASPDGIIEHTAYGLPFGGVLEVKCPFFNGEIERAFPWHRVPLYYMPQAQGLMEILDRDWMDLYCWTPNGSSLFRIQRDKQYWEIIRLALHDFWWKHVQPAKDLCRQSSSTDLFTVVEPFCPRPRHELCPTIVRASKLLVDDSKLMVREIHVMHLTRVVGLFGHDRVMWSTYWVLVESMAI